MHTNTRDDHAFNIHFVALVQKKKCLYDKTLPEYRNKDEHDKAWERIAAEVNENGEFCLVFYEWNGILFCVKHIDLFHRVT